MRKLRSATRAPEEIAASAETAYHTAKGNGQMAGAPAGDVMRFAAEDYRRLMMHALSMRSTGEAALVAPVRGALHTTAAPTAAAETRRSCYQKSVTNKSAHI